MEKSKQIFKIRHFQIAELSSTFLNEHDRADCFLFIIFMDSLYSASTFHLPMSLELHNYPSNANNERNLGLEAEVENLQAE